MAREFYIYFSDLNQDAQQALLDFVGAESPEEENWDIDMCPIAVYSRADEFEWADGVADEEPDDEVDDEPDYDLDEDADDQEGFG